MKVNIWTDGASYKHKGPSTDSPRRGHAGAGYVVEGGGIRWEGKKPLGLATNNEAEYHAVLGALELALELEADEAHIQLDSDVVYGHVELGTDCNYPYLLALLQEVRHRRSLLPLGVTFECVDRSLNKEADRLAVSAKEMSLAGVTDEERTSRVTSWDLMTRQLPRLYAKLLAAPFFKGSGNDLLPNKAGVYLFTESGLPVYVGQTRSFRRRYSDHLSSSHLRGHLAFNLAKEQWLRANPRVQKLTRAKMVEEAEFQTEHAKALRRVSQMGFQCVEVLDPTLRTVFEVYASVESGTNGLLNRFDTH